ncbi:polyamine aminopropyltransferase [Nitrosomonas stercoris]|uniref:Polyamine aminopropyltransferase n=1 Tax=Nitrosomonas stercoris TaxID=1444684 RepID=A0A4Y1YKD8_9PROT|nr:polyamine aminopropyltransferase [Nitrosomonas stercoris]
METIDHTKRRYLAEQLGSNFGFYLREHQRLVEVNSAWQKIEIIENQLFGRIMRIDSCFMTSERDEFFYHEPMVHLPAISHGGPRRALIVGGGDGGAAEELLKYSELEHLVLAELDEEVIRLAREWLPTIHRNAFDDPRLELRLGDALPFIEKGTERFDQIILDLTDPFGPATDLYTVEFYRACKKLLNPGGVISLHIGSPIHLQVPMARIAASLRAVFAIVRPYLQYVPLYGTLWCMAMASDTVDPATLSVVEVDARLNEQGLHDLQLYNGATHHALLAQPNFVLEILQQPVKPIHRGETLEGIHSPESLPGVVVIPTSD